MLEFSLATKAGNLERRCLKACIGYLAVIHEVQILISTLMGAGCWVQVMGSRPRSDIHVNLPALRKLDNMLLVCPQTFETCRLFP
jgi:hypothetical protein